MISTILRPVTYFRNLIYKGHSRSVIAKKNIIVSLLIKGMSVSLGFLLVPLTLQYVDSTRYGVWITISSMAGWLSFFDVGIGNGLRNKFTEAVARDQHKRARVYVSTTYAVLSVVAVLLLLLFFSLNPLLNWAKILNTPDSMAQDLSLLATIVFTFFCVQFVLQLITTILTANQESAKASLCQFSGTLILFAFIYILTRTTTGNLIYLGTAYGVSTSIVLLGCSLWLYTHKYSRYAPSFRYIKPIFAGRLLSIGAQFLIIQLGALVLFQTDNIIIAQLFSPEDVTEFNIAYKLFSCVNIVFTIMISPMWSAYTDAYSRGDLAWIRRLFIKTQKIWLLVPFSATTLLLASPYIFELWIGKAIQISSILSITIVVYAVSHSWLTIPCSLLNGIGKIRLQLYLYVICILTNIPLSIMFGRLLGLPGIALANFIVFLLMDVALTVQCNKILRGTSNGIWNK